MSGPLETRKCRRKTRRWGSRFTGGQALRSRCSPSGKKNVTSKDIQTALHAFGPQKRHLRRREISSVTVAFCWGMWEARPRPSVAREMYGYPLVRPGYSILYHTTFAVPYQTPLRALSWPICLPGCFLAGSTGLCEVRSRVSCCIVAGTISNEE